MMMTGYASERSAGARPTTIGLCGLALMGIAMLAGCGKGNGRGPLYPAEGQVLLNRRPLGGAIVVLYPQGVADEKAVPSRAQTGPDGKFHVGTFDVADGVPAGQYAVTVIHYPMRQNNGGWTSGANDLPQKYASPKTTDLRVKIGDGTKTLPTLVLQAPQGSAWAPSSTWQ
jgi:hypothetical protein